ncbi:MAG: HD domain-containing protein [Pseudomonadota bacterium]
MSDDDDNADTTLILSFDEPEDLAVLRYAAEIAERSVEDFVKEEILHLADTIAATSSLRYVELARDKEAENRAFIEVFQAAAKHDTVVADWAARQAAREAAGPRAPSLEQTREWAEALHAEQTDAAGAPYAKHLARAAEHLTRLFPHAGPAERHAVWLHDAMEDQGVTAQDLHARGYGRRVIEIVTAVTRPDDGRSYAAWIEGIAASGDADAMRVKLADLADNADPARLATLPPDRAASLGQRYARAQATLTAALERVDGGS